jgi:transcriptional regulator with XRE-family HTH domain
MTGAAEGPASTHKDPTDIVVKADGERTPVGTSSGATDAKTRSPFVLIDTASLDSHLIGTRLRLRREVLGKSLQDVASALNYKPDLLRAIEEMDSQAVGQKGGLRYKIQKIAELLQMAGAKQIAEAYYEQIADRLDDVPAETSQAIGHKGQGLPPYAPVVGGTFLAVVLVLVVAQTSNSNQGDTAPGNGDRYASTLDTALLEAARADAAEGKVTLMIKALRSAMIDVRGPDGTIYIQRVLKEGESYPPRMGASWTLSTRDAGAFRVFVNGVDTGFLGGDGQSIYAWRVDTAAGRLPAPAPPPRNLPPLSNQGPVTTIPQASTPRQITETPRPLAPTNPYPVPTRPVAETPALPPGVTPDQTEEEKRRAQEAFEREVLDFN